MTGRYAVLPSEMVRVAVAVGVEEAPGRGVSVGVPVGVPVGAPLGVTLGVAVTVGVSVGCEDVVQAIISA
jgi:hypothetical protein